MQFTLHDVDLLREQSATIVAVYADIRKDYNGEEEAEEEEDEGAED